MERGTLGRLLRAQRVRHDLTVRQIAERLGVSAMTVSNLERGVRIPVEVDLLKKIADAYDIAVSRVLTASLESQAAGGAVELPTDEARPEGAATALALARAWRELTEEDMAEIRTIVDRRWGGVC